jgi:hypothetical protein
MQRTCILLNLALAICTFAAMLSGSLNGSADAEEVSVLAAFVLMFLVVAGALLTGHRWTAAIAAAPLVIVALLFSASVLTGGSPAPLQPGGASYALAAAGLMISVVESMAIFSSLKHSDLPQGNKRQHV